SLLAGRRRLFRAAGPAAVRGPDAGRDPRATDDGPAAAAARIAGRRAAGARGGAAAGRNERSGGPLPERPRVPRGATESAGIHAAAGHLPARGLSEREAAARRWGRSTGPVLSWASL